MMISAKCAQCISVIMQWIAGTLLHPSALYIYSASPAARDWRCFSIQVARKAFLPACSKFSLQSDTASNKWVERWGLRGGVRREQREGDSCPHGFGLLCLTEYLWITWNSTENTPNHTSYPTERFGKGVKLEERVLIVMKTQDFLCFLSCFASFELGKLCFAFFSKLLPPTLLACVFTAGLSNCPHCLLLARREWGVDCVPCLFKLFTPAFFCSQCFIVFFQRAASQRLAYPLPSSLAALRHHVSKRLLWRSWGKLRKTFSGSLFSCLE